MAVQDTYPYCQIYSNSGYFFPEKSIVVDLSMLSGQDIFSDAFVSSDHSYFLPVLNLAMCHIFHKEFT
jgi:hypothetical protein